MANSFDAGALRVGLLMSPNLNDQDATIVVIDDGEGMDAEGLKQHWLIGISNKRRLTTLPRNRQQIGKFGIGKLATYVLADRLTHVSKCDGKYYSTSMDFTAIDKRVDREVEPKTPIKIPLRELSESEAKDALATWTETPAFKAMGMPLFGKGAPASWTVAIMSALKEKAHVLRAICNAVRPRLEKHEEEEQAGAKLARKLAASPASLSRRPIIELARAVVEGRGRSRYLIVPELATPAARAEFLASLERRESAAENFVTGVTIDYDASARTGIARFDTATGQLRINAWHPFVATFHDEFASKGAGQPLELFAMAEVLAEAQLVGLGLKQDQIDAFLSARDELLRYLATSSGRQGAFAAALALQDARNDSDALEDKLCGAFSSPCSSAKYSVMLSRSSSRVSSPVALADVRCSAATTAPAGWPSPSPWSSRKAARPTAESSSPYKVWGRLPIIFAYATCLYVKTS